MLSDTRTKLDTEIARLETLYFVSTITYQREASARHKASRGAERPIEFKTPAWRREVAKNAGHFQAIVNDVLPKALRETIFVRLVSALEVFHVDFVRAIYVARRDLLQTQNTIELSYAFLASVKSVPELITKLVDRDCRMLTSGGFNAITKYYKQKFGIDLQALSQFKQLKEIHDRRHILVHRLGHTDEQYRHSYSYGRRRLSIDQAYLLSSIQAIRTFSQSVLDLGNSLPITLAAGSSVRQLSDLSVFLETLSSEAENITSPDYFFLYNEHYYSIRDLIVERTVSGKQINLVLRGHKNVMRVYLRKINALAKLKKLTIIKPSKTRNVKL